MLVYLVFGVAVAFYFCQLPVRLAFTLTVGEQNTLRMGVGLFQARYIVEKRFALRDVIRIDSMLDHPGQLDMPLIRASLRGLRRFAKGVRLEGGRLSIQIGTGGAAQTALLTGACAALLRGFAAARAPGLHAKLTPDFSRASLALSMGGIAHVSAGHIIYATAAFVRHLSIGRISQWTGTQLKIS